MKLIPFENIRLISKLDNEEIAERISSRAEYTEQFGVSFHKNSFKDYEGYANGKEFKIRRILKSGRNSFIPTAHGKMQSQGNEKIISVRIRLLPLVYILLIFMTVLLGTFLLFDPTVVDLVFFLIPYLFCIIFYNLESQRLKNGLMEIIK